MINTTQRPKIDAHWSIGMDGFRRATVDQYDLVTTNRRDDHGWGPIRWSVWLGTRRLADGQVWQSTRYSSLVREAMYLAEQWVRDQGQLTEAEQRLMDGNR